MEKVFWLGNTKPAHYSSVGEKGYYLSFVDSVGLPVIPGFVVTSEVLTEFWQSHPWSNPLFGELPASSLYLNVDDSRQLSRLAQNIRQEIKSATLPTSLLTQLVSTTDRLNSPLLIFRPSLSLLNSTNTGTLDFSGLLESHLAVYNPSQPDRNRTEIDRALHRCWAELFRARSLLYWHRAGVDLKDICLAVLVQPVWPTKAAGEILIEAETVTIKATWGLGHSLRFGAVSPDIYQVNLDTGTLENRHLGHKPVAYFPVFGEGESLLEMQLLNQEQQNSYSLDSLALEKLTDIAQKIAPQSTRYWQLEWALSKPVSSSLPEIYLTQAKPIIAKGLNRPSNWPLTSGEPSLGSKGVLQGRPASKGTVSGPVYQLNIESERESKLPSGCILIAKMIPPGGQHLLTNVAAVVTEQGSMTCHAAILARELGIPAVVGVAGVMDCLHNGDWVEVDGDKGYVLLQSSPESSPVMVNSPAYRMNVSQINSERELGLNLELGTQIFLNVSQFQAVEGVNLQNVDGVGLLRGELLLNSLLPNSLAENASQPIAHLIQPIASAFFPKPVFYRSVDRRAQESGLGVHGTFSYMLDARLFDAELEALAHLQEAGYKNLHLILPFVRSVEEFIFCRQRVEVVGLKKHPGFQLWVMIEVPSLLFFLPDLIAAGVEGFALGSNDLTQFLLAASRNDSQMVAAFDARHPAVLRAFEQVIRAAQKGGIPCCLCGVAASFPDVIEQLVGWGITGISVEPDAVEGAILAVARAEKRLLLQAARGRLKGLGEGATGYS